jgi:hypothetical protein
MEAARRKTIHARTRQGAAGSFSVRFRAPSRNARGWLTARLDTPDALPFDNIAYAVLPAPAPHRVLLVTKGNWFLEKLLAGRSTGAVRVDRAERLAGGFRGEV